MKTSLFCLLFLFVTNFGFCQTDEFTNAMNETLLKLKEVKTQQDYQTLANQFERISNTEKSRWEPLYYTAFCYILMSYQEQDGSKKDALLDIADKNIEKAFLIEMKESELFTLQGMSYQARISVSPIKRGHEYSEKSNTELEKAKVLNPENPRIYYLMAMNYLNTPKFFGGGASKALPYFEQAKEKYDKFAPSNTFSPKWGKERNEKMVEECKKS